ncbi:MAG: HD domain-containing protein [Leptolyngbyaceae cyanobacterium SM1_1_3]|nr:HD domain-containing protein [Leptolyngbyaceae cyanobacterium SM1_1_3]NJM85810.1 HD domain-containing protein [Leptolyngbyaceae cyanobacterium RM2_2_21]NJN03574.1 HD domain-containing protein [Leptolyngbyaceae cyanobacterium RM1_1_2]NJO11377.1 HD domain-containing protein [Leptolyngbyaceae cyanobacterium SL_1_1]
MREQVLIWLDENLPKPRIKHVLRVEKLAVELAQHHKLDAEAAAQAGLMHDLAKYFQPERLLQMAQQANLNLDPVEAAHPHLLHAEIGAIVAEEEFGITDPVVLAAIRNHTLGAAHMDGVSCVVFLADSLEPGRGQQSDLNRLRQLCYENLSHAVYETCEYTLIQLLQSRKLIHPRAICTRNWFLQASQALNSTLSA